MTARKPTSDEQFEYDGPKTELDQLFDHHGVTVYDPYQINPTLSIQEEEDLGADLVEGED